MTTGSILPEVKLMSKPRSTSTTNIINSTSATKASNGGVPVVMQPEINRRGSWSNPPKLPKPDPPKVIKPPSATSASDTPAISANTAFIDSALLAALRDPRERIGLLRLEQTLIDFVVKQPQDLHVDVGGPYNSIVKSPTLGLISSGIPNANKSQTSFQRCILHRLADRFEITRENNMDGTIRLLKQAQTKIPSRLLLDVKPEEYSLVQSMEQVSLNTSNNNNQNGTATPSNTKPIAVAGASKPKTSRRNSNEVSVVVKKNNSDSNKAVTKMKIMKRANSCPADSSMHRTNSSASLKKKNSSLTDREKAYAEARARIFQQEEEEEQQQDESDDANGTASGTASTDSGAVLLESSEETQETKATFRDRNQDEIDPDFRRGSQLNVGLDYGGGEHYTNPTKDYYGYYNAPQQYPRHYAPQAQAWVPTDAASAAAYYPHQYHAHYPATTTTQGQQTYVASTSSAQDLTSKIVANSDSVGG